MTGLAFLATFDGLWLLPTVETVALAKFIIRARVYRQLFLVCSVILLIGALTNLRLVLGGSVWLDPDHIETDSLCCLVHLALEFPRAHLAHLSLKDAACF